MQKKTILPLVIFNFDTGLDSTAPIVLLLSFGLISVLFVVDDVHRGEGGGRGKYRQMQTRIRVNFCRDDVDVINGQPQTAEI